MVSPFAIIRVASLGSIGLNVRDGRLYGPPATIVPPDLATAIRAHKLAIVAALEFLATNATIRNLNAARPDVGILTDAGREEAATIAADLARTGGLGQFVNDLFHTWNDLTPSDRAAACHAWRLAANTESLREAA